MTVPLNATLKRALTIGSRDYVVTLTNETLKVTLKGKRRGVELTWANIVSGDAALAVALQASIGAFAPQEMTDSAKTPKPPRAKASKKVSSRK